MMDPELKEALEEVLAHHQGQQVLNQRNVRLEPSHIQGIRQKQRLSQEEFAALFGVSVRTLQQWEQGRRHPQGPARVLLKVISHHPEIVQEALGL
jgi:putative transcriptional regulator